MNSVLVVDDQSICRKVLSAFLSHMGFADIVTAEDGAAALSLLATRTVDLIVSDCHMAPMDGLELLRCARNDDRLGNIPFLFVTVELDRVFSARASCFDRTAIISKPIREADFRAMLADVVDLTPERLSA